MRDASHRTFERSITALKTFLISFFTVVFLGGCGADPASEEAIREFIKSGELAVETADLSELKEKIASDYSDTSGRTREDLLQYIRYQVLRNRSIHLFVSVSEISLVDGKTAEVRFIVGMTGVDAKESEIRLKNIKADIYSFSCRLTLVDKKWQLSEASWRPANLEDLFPE